jgi:hypothetical protein
MRSLRIFPTSTVVEAAPPLPETSTTLPATAPTSTVTGAVAAPVTTPPTTTAPTSVVTKPATAPTTTSRPSISVRPRPAPTTTTTAAQPTGVVDEQSDNGYVFVYSNDPAANTSGSATTLERATTPRRLEFTVSGAMDHGPVAKFDVAITNVSGRQMVFPGGLDVRWVVQHDGAPWKTVHLTRPEITGLAPGGKLSGSAQAILDQFGDYSFTAIVSVQYR